MAAQGVAGLVGGLAQAFEGLGLGLIGGGAVDRLPAQRHDCQHGQQEGQVQQKRAGDVAADGLIQAVELPGRSRNVGGRAAL